MQAVQGALKARAILLIKRRRYEQGKAFTSIIVNSVLSVVKMQRVRYIATNVGLHPKGDLLLVNEQWCVPTLGIRYRAICVFTERHRHRHQNRLLQIRRSAHRHRFYQ